MHFFVELGGDGMAKAMLLATNVIFH